MIRVEIKSNIDDVRKRFATLADDIQDKATVSALNRTATTVRAAAVKEIRSAYPGIKAGAIRDDITIRRARRGNLEATVTARGGRIPLIDVAARQTKRGVTVKIKGASKLIPHAFIATMKSGHRGVFVRVRSTKPMVFRHGKGSRMSQKRHDLPIAELSTLPLPWAFGNKVVLDVLQRLASETFNKNFAAELRYRTSKV